MGKLLLLMLGAAAAWPQTVANRIERIVRETPVLRQSVWGISVTDAETGSILFERSSNVAFTPASTTKLFSSALALSRLGPTYSFTTRVLAAGPLRDGVLDGDLRLVGGGDPNFSARLIPYRRRDPFAGNLLAPIDDLAAQIEAAGIRRVTGGIIGDDTLFEFEPFPPGWAEGDAAWRYGAPVSALAFNDSSFRIRIHPGAAAGEPVRLEAEPAFEHLVIHNHAFTSGRGERRIAVTRLAGDEELLITGALPAGSAMYEAELAAADPAAYAAAALREALLRRGITVEAAVRPAHRLRGEEYGAPAGVEVARRESAPLADALRIVNKDSENLHAELILRAAAARVHGSATRAQALLELRNFIQALGVSSDKFQLEDGSGLSRLNLVPPSLLTRLLVFMYNSEHRETWTGLLPVAGLDGTLEKRLTSAGDRVRAKTGSLSHVAALAGYVMPAGGRPKAFAILLNNYTLPAAAARAAIDKMVMALLD